MEKVTPIKKLLGQDNAGLEKKLINRFEGGSKTAKNEKTKWGQEKMLKYQKGIEKLIGPGNEDIVNEVLELFGLTIEWLDQEKQKAFGSEYEEDKLGLMHFSAFVLGYKFSKH